MPTTEESAQFSIAAVADAVRDLAPKIAARAREIEASRRLPLDLLDALKGAGCFRMLLPRTHGGGGVELPAAMRVYEELARADASVGWTVMIGSSAWIDVAGIPRETFDALYADGRDVVFAGAFNPTGTAVRVDGGYQVTGRWAFASGCEHADWLFGNCVEEHDGSHRLRIVVFSPDDVEIEDTWDVSGLCGTGSHHFSARNVVVPEARTTLALDHEPCLDETLLQLPPPALISLEIAAVALGTAQGSLDEVVDLATAKVPLLASAPLAANPLFQHRLATAETALRAARALLYEEASAAWATASAKTPFTLDQRARIRATGAWATSIASSVVDAAYEAGGGSSLYRDCPLQRRLRDIRALAQHFLVRADTLTTAGAVLAGQEIDLPVF